MRFIKLSAAVKDSAKSICGSPGLQFRSVVTSCRAVVLPRFGAPELLEIRHDVEVPDLKPGEVLVRTRAVSVNPLDTKVREGYGRSVFEPHLPIILGRDVSGEVAATGSSVRLLSVGQEVFGALHPTAIRGTYTDYAILPEDQLALKPSSMTHVDASAIPFAAQTAWRALNCTARVARGQRVFIIGGGGAVGLSAIQLSVAAGCHASASCAPESIGRLLEAGAKQAIDYTSENWEKTIMGQFDAVLDCVGIPDTEQIGINLLKKGGHYMTLQGEAASLCDKHGMAIGLALGTGILLKKFMQYKLSHDINYTWTYMRPDAEALQDIRRLAEAGKFKIPVDKTFPVTQVREAHLAKEKRLFNGKIVLEFD